MQKNVAGQKWVVFAFDRTTNEPKTGDAANITANLRIDGGAANPVDDTNPTELEAGYYVFDITQAESNGNYIAISPSSVTADIQVIGVPGAVWTTELPTLVAAIKVITDALTAAGASKLAISTGVMVTGTVSHDNTPATTTVFYCDDITEATPDHYNGRIIIFVSGILQYQATSISDYELSAGEGKFTVVALTEAPGDNDEFIIV